MLLEDSTTLDRLVLLNDDTLCPAPSGRLWGLALRIPAAEAARRWVIVLDTAADPSFPAEPRDLAEGDDVPVTSRTVLLPRGLA